MKIILEDHPGGMRVRIWDGRPKPGTDRVVGGKVALKVIEAVKSILNLYGGFDR